MQRSPRTRLAALLFALLQVLAPAASTWADARLAAESSGGAASHVEAQTSTSCPRVHPTDCALCHHVGTVGCAAPRVELPAIRREIRSPVSLGAATAGSTVRHALGLPRAPPVS